MGRPSEVGKLITALRAIPASRWKPADLVGLLYLTDQRAVEMGYQVTLQGGTVEVGNRIPDGDYTVGELAALLRVDDE